MDRREYVYQIIDEFWYRLTGQSMDPDRINADTERVLRYEGKHNHICNQKEIIEIAYYDNYYNKISESKINRIIKESINKVLNNLF